MEESILFTLEWAYSYGFQVQKARHLNEEEKVHYREEYKNLIFISLGDQVELSEIGSADAPKRESDGEFLGSANQAWIITETEYQNYINLNAERVQKKERVEREQKIKALSDKIKSLESMELLATRSECREKERKYNLLHNEGGEGFVPHFYSQEDLETYRSQLEEMKKEC